MARSAPFVGRTDALRRLSELLTGRSDERVAVVVGDAGLGKSRLVAEAEVRAGTALLPLHGACLPLAEALPLLPLTEALRDLGRRDDGRLLEQALRSRPAFVRRELARLLPELPTDEGDAGAGGPGEGWRRQVLFTAVWEILAGAADRRQVALVVEDLHWADRTSLDLLRFLLGSRGGSPLPLVVTLRADEPSMNLAVGDWLAGVASLPQVVTVRLTPLSRDEAAEQAIALMGHDLSTGTLQALYARTEGNPFFAEQLLAAGDACGEAGFDGEPLAQLPPDLATVLSARVTTVSASAQQLLAVLAVAGRGLDEAMLATIAGLDGEVVDDALIELLQASLISTDRHGLHRPRHALLAEVVEHQLLPARRRRLHARLAEALAARGETPAAELAAHWAAAGRPVEELASTITAGRQADITHAWPEAARHWERVIQLWDHVEPPPTDTTLAAAYLAAIDASRLSGDSPRAGALTEQALSLADRIEPKDKALLWYHASIYRRPESLEAMLSVIELAVKVFSGLPASREKRAALGRYGIALAFAGRRTEARQVLSECLRVARDMGTQEDEALAYRGLAAVEVVAGDADHGLALLTHAWELSRSSTDLETVLDIAINQTTGLIYSGELERGCDIGREALGRVRLLGGASSTGAAMIAASISDALLNLGRVDEAADLLDPLTDGEPTLDDWAVYNVRVRADLARGHLDRAWERFRAAKDLAPANQYWMVEFQDMPEFQVNGLEVAQWCGRLDEALPDAVDLLARLDTWRLSSRSGPLLVASIAGYATLAERARTERNPARLDAALAGAARVQALHAGMSVDPFDPHPLVATAAADHATWTAETGRLHGRTDSDQWRRAAEAWIGLRRSHRAGYALWRQAQALLDTGRRSEAEPVLRHAATLAADMIPLQQRITALARRARISPDDQLPPTPRPKPTAYGLTKRELDVLRLLAEGRTNSEIGRTLYMSPKTASVHVSRILQKLGVSGRLQAAMTAERAGLIDPSATFPD